MVQVVEQSWFLTPNTKCFIPENARAEQAEDQGEEAVEVQVSKLSQEIDEKCGEHCRVEDVSGQHERTKLGELPENAHSNLAYKVVFTVFLLHQTQLFQFVQVITSQRWAGKPEF